MICKIIRNNIFMITAEEIKQIAKRGESFNVDFKVTVP